MQEKSLCQLDNNKYFVEETHTINGFVPNNCIEANAPTIEDGFVFKWNGNAFDKVENHIGERGYVDNEPFEITEYGAYPVGWSSEYVKSLQELKDEALTNLEILTARVRAEQSTFNGITIAKTYENINEWLTFAKYKSDENITIPAQAVMMSYSGQNMNEFSVPQIEGAMYQAMLAITTINADYYRTLASIENATTAEEIPNIQG